MDIKLLEGEVLEMPLGAQALISIASRQKRRQYFYRSLLRCALLSILFIAFGCFFAIYSQERGNTAVINEIGALPFDFRGMLKELFLQSLIPSVCFALCYFSGGRFYMLCGTFFPALYGTAAGAYFYTRLTSLFTSFSVSYAVSLAPFLAQTLCFITVCTVFCPVCACYGRCRRQNDAANGDLNNCFTYYLISLTVIAMSLIMRDSASFFLKTVG